MKDLLVIGGGPAGASAGIYGARYNLDLAVITKEMGGNLLKSQHIENYPGLGKIAGEEAADELEDHLKMFDVPIHREEVAEVKKEDGKFEVSTKKGNVYESKTVIICTGTKERKLDIPGEEEYRGKGVGYCAICDAALYKDAEVGVVGGSDSAAKEALLLSEHASEVYIIYRGDEIHPEPALKKKVMEKDNIEVITDTEVTKVKGDQLMKSAELSKPYEGSKELEIEGLFIAIGGVPLTEIIRDMDIEQGEKGGIKVNDRMETNVEGLYAAGDITQPEFKQIITAAYQGSRAAHSAYQHLKE